MRKLALLFFFFPLATLAQGPATTTVQGPVFGLDGGLANGTVRIVSPVAFKSSDGFYIAQNTQYLAQIANGVLSVALVPNTYDQAGNLLDFYTATYTLTTGTYTEYWIVPSTSPVQVPAVISPVLPVPGIQVNVYQLVPPVNCQSLGGFPKFIGFWTCSSGGGATIQTNGTQNTSQLILNFQNPASFQGLSFAFSNPSAGIETFSVSGTLNNAGLTNPSTTVNSQPCTLGASCTIPFQTNGLANASQAGLNLQNSAPVSGVSVNVTNPSSNNAQLSLSGFPSLTTAGDVMYFNGSALARLAGNTSGTNCFQENPSGVPSFGACGGATPAAPGNTLQKSNSGVTALAASGETDDGTTFGTSLNARFIGPNPYVDITAFGAIACNLNATPCALGLTANISSGSAVATISSASTFVNPSGNIPGSGVVIYGAGALNNLTTPGAPTVTNVLASGGTGTGVTLPGAPGATTKCYKIAARDVNGGLTAASPETCTTTGQATLGAVTVNITSQSRSGTTVTTTTGSAHPVLVGTGGGEVFIVGTGDISFDGWYPVSSAADTTHFTWNNQLVSTATGASTSSTGGTATFYPANHLSWNAVTNAWLYYIYCGASGAETRCGVSNPLDTTWDDFANLQTNWDFPPFIPTTPPTSPTADNLSTTIVSGAGTTTLTLANAASTTVSGATIRLDSAPAIKAAAAASNGTLLIPAPIVAGNFFPINSFVDLRNTSVNMQMYGSIQASDTLAVNTIRLRGYQSAPVGSAGPGSWSGGKPGIAISGGARPGLYVQNTSNGPDIGGIGFSGCVNTNGCLLVLAEGAFNMNFDTIDFVTGQSANDLMGIGLYLRGNPGQSAASVVLDKVSFSAGNTAGGASHNPTFYCNQCGDVHVREAYSVHRGMIFSSTMAGGQLEIDNWHINGGGTPFLSLVHNGGASVTAVFGNIIMDTIAQPCVAVLGDKAILNFKFGCVPALGFPAVTAGNNVSEALGIGSMSPSSLNAATTNTLSNAILGGNTSANVTTLVDFTAGSKSVSSDSSFLVEGAVAAAPVLTVNAGGSITPATYTWVSVPLWWNGEEGVPSQVSTPATTTTGNQSLTVSYTTVSGNPQCYRLYWSNGGGYANPNNIGCTNTNPVTVTTLGPQLFVLGSLHRGGPVTLGAQGITTPSITLAGVPFTSLFYQTVQNASGVAQTQRPTIEFTGSAVTSVLDDSANTRTVVTLTAGAGGSGCAPPGTTANALLYDSGTSTCSDVSKLTWNSGTTTLTGLSGLTLDLTASTLFKTRVSAGLTTSANGDIGTDSTTGIPHAFVNGADRLALASTNTGASGQVAISNGNGTYTMADPIVSYGYVNLFNAANANATQTSAITRVSTFSQFGTLFITWASITGSPVSCTIQMKSADSLGNLLANGAAISVSPANGSVSQAFIPAAGLQSSAQMQAVYTCGTYPTAGTLTLDFSPQFTNNVVNTVAVNHTQVNGVSLGSPSAYGTSPGAVNVPGVNAFITNSPTVSVSGTTTVAGSKTNNNAAPGATNIGTLPCLANAANPSWTEGNQVSCSVDLSGDQRTLINSWFGSAAPTVGQKTMANSIPIVPASDYVPSDTVGTIGALNASNATASVVLAGQQGASVLIASGTLAATVVPEYSTDGGTTWNRALFWNADQSASQCGITQNGVANNIVVTNPNPNCQFGIVGVPSGSSNVRVRNSAFTSGTANATIRAALGINQRQLDTQYDATGAALGAFANFGTSPGAVSALGANASIFAGTTALSATGSSLNVNITGGAGSGGTAMADEGAFTQGTTQFTPSGCFFNSAITNLTSGQAGSFQCTNDRNLFVNVNKWAGSALGAMANYGTSPGAVLVPGVNAFVTNTVGVSGTVTANIGTTNGLALDATVSGLQVAQASTTSGQKGGLDMCAVTTGAPTYTTAQTDPLSCDTSGNLRTLVSGTVTANAGTGTFNIQANASVNLTQVNSVALGSPSNYGTSPGAVSVMGVNAFVTNTVAVSGTVTSNIGTTNGLALDATVSGLQVAQGSTTSGQKGGLDMGAVTTTAPSYVNGQTDPLSLDTSGNLRVNCTVGCGALSATYNTVPNWANPLAPLSLSGGANANLQLDAFGRLITIDANSSQILAALNVKTPANSLRLLGTFNRPISSTADALDVNIKYPEPLPLPTAQASAALTPVRIAALTTAQTVKTGPGNLWAWFVYNPNSTACFLDFFNTTSPSLGTTVPLWTISLPATSAANVSPGQFAYANFSQAWSVAAVTATGGASLCGTGAVVQLSIF